MTLKMIEVASKHFDTSLFGNHTFQTQINRIIIRNARFFVAVKIVKTHLERTLSVKSSIGQDKSLPLYIENSRTGSLP
jgi:hypothetical protein